MWTKRELVNEAFAELALAGHQFDLEPEEMQTALRRMDAMVAAWEAKGIRIGYALPSGPSSSDLDDASGIPDAAVQAVFLGLAVQLAPGFGKTLPPETRKSARDAYDALLIAAAQPPEQQLTSNLPMGAGFKRRERIFFPIPDTSPVQTTQGGDLDILPE